MMIITNKINIATKYLRQLKKDIRLLTLNMDIIRDVGEENTDVVEREFRLLKSKFYCLELSMRNIEILHMTLLRLLRKRMMKLSP